MALIDNGTGLSVESSNDAWVETNCGIKCRRIWRENSAIS